MGSRFALRSFGAVLATLGLALSATAPVQAAPIADTDGDRVFDELEGRVRALADDRRVRVIVALSREASRERVRGLEDRVSSLDASKRFGVVDAFAAEIAAGEVRELARQSGVEHVERDLPVTAFNSSAQAAFGVTTVRTALPGLDGDADGALASYSPGDLVAAVIDTGIDAAHTDLNEGKVIAFQDFTEPSFDSAVDPAYDDNGHGTHVAGTIAGDGDGHADGAGVAPGAALVGLKVLDANGNGFSSDVIAAINWTVSHREYGIDVINLSLGSDGCSDGTDTESQAVAAAVSAGIVVAAAAGNEGPGRCTIGSPGASASALTVGAIADPGVGGFYMADFSSRGRTADGRVKPDVVAPGVRIRSADANTAAGYAVASGTSMATPFVAGTVLLMRQQNAAMTAAQVKEAITSTALDWGRGGDQTTPGSAGLDIDHGYGRLDAHAAIEAAGAPLGAGPTVPVHRRLSSTLGGTGDFETFTVVADSATRPLAVTMTLADDDLDGDGVTDPITGTGGTVFHEVDFDMKLTDAGGTPIQVLDLMGAARSAAETGYRQDAFYRPAETPRTYTLRVESFRGAGDYLLDVSGGTIVPAGATSAPTVTTLPSISGTLAAGQTLTATVGAWNVPVTGTLRWLRCNSTGSECSETGKTGSSYVVTDADGGKRLKVVVVAASGSGEGSADSALTTTTVPVVAPTLIQTVSISGQPRQGAALTAVAGEWNGTLPLNRTYQWERCNSAGASCAPIAGASTGAYTPGTSDIGSTLRVVETVSNAGGQQSAASVVTAPITGETAPAEDPAPQPDPILPVETPAISQTGANVVSLPPVNELPPRLSGVARHGQLLRADDGIWRGLSPIAFGHRWLRCNSIGFDCAEIAGASGATYRLRGADIERRIAVRVLASNADGSGRADSVPSVIVQPTRPANRRKPSIAGRAARGGVLRANGGIWWGTPTISFTATWLRCNRSGGRCKAVGRKAAYAPGPGDVGHRLRLRITALNGGGRRASTSRASAVVRSVPNKQRPARAGRLVVRVAREPDAAAALQRVRVR